MSQITVSTHINASLEKVWNAFTNPVHIVNWNFASEDWCCPKAETDIKDRGFYKSRMEAKDGSFGFDFSCVIDSVETTDTTHKTLKLTMEDGRKWDVGFEAVDGAWTKVTELFDPESENPEEMQREGWQSILNNFKKYVEGLK